MDAGRQSDLAAGRASTTVERVSERELAVTRTVNGPARLVFEAGPSRNCSSDGGHPDRSASSWSRTKPMFAQVARTAW